MLADTGSKSSHPTTPNACTSRRCARRLPSASTSSARSRSPQCRRVRRARTTRGRGRRRPLHELPQSLLPDRPGFPRARARGRARRSVERARRVLAGLARISDGLELAPRDRARGRAARGRGRRHALARHGTVRDRAQRRRAARRPRHGDPDPTEAGRGGRDLLRGGRGRARGRRHHNRRSRAHPSALRERRARVGRPLPGRRRPQELVADRGGRIGGRAGVGLGAPRGALARAARRTERRRAAERRDDAPGRCGSDAPSGRTRRGLRRRVPRAIRRRVCGRGAWWPVRRSRLPDLPRRSHWQRPLRCRRALEPRTPLGGGAR